MQEFVCVSKADVLSRGLLRTLGTEIHYVVEEVQTLTGGPLGPMMDRPGSPGAPCGQKHEEEKKYENSQHVKVFLAPKCIFTSTNFSEKLNKALDFLKLENCSGSIETMDAEQWRSSDCS